MHTIDTSNYQLRTDLIIEEKIENENVEEEQIDKIIVNRVEIKEDLNNKKKGKYTTISFEDITDKDNFKKVEKVLINELKKYIETYHLTEQDTILIIGLGNPKSTPDSLGPKVVEQVLVTRYLYMLGEVEKGYKKVAAFKPEVTGTTGIETKEVVESLVQTTKAKLVIVIDALAASSINRVNRTIQITNTGINPGSGVGNNRQEISYGTLNIPVLAIGIPTIVDAATIVSDTFQYMLKQFSYKLNNINNQTLKFVHTSMQNYLKEKQELSKEKKEEVLGLVGTLTEEEFKQLIYEVLSPINSNLMVTPKEVDFLIDKLSLLISNGLNKTLHESFNPTN